LNGKLTNSDTIDGRYRIQKMTRDDQSYTFRTTWSEEDAVYVGLRSEFPSLSWLASTPEPALEGIRTLVADIAPDLRVAGEPVRWTS
jgi:hypothetical protein